MLFRMIYYLVIICEIFSRFNEKVIYLCLVLCNAMQVGLNLIVSTKIFQTIIAYWLIDSFLQGWASIPKNTSICILVPPCGTLTWIERSKVKLFLLLRKFKSVLKAIKYSTWNFGYFLIIFLKFRVLGDVRRWYILFDSRTCVASVCFPKVAR